ncbi:hypothetical protein F9K79_00720 [Ochrobactrum sp. Kaboul]|nr:hypothetical protein F9K79_00720 [Ochrobactrum sp. Kaboul]
MSNYKIYLLSFNDNQVSRNELVDLIDKSEEVVNWIAPMPSTLFLVSESSIQSLNKFIMNHREKKFQYIIAEVNRRQGWLPKATWDFIQNPKSVDDE